MKRVFEIVLILIAVSLSTALCSVAHARDRISVTGAYSMWGRVHSIAMAYEKDHPQVAVSVLSHSLVDQGIKALIEGKTDVAMASRKITPRESEEAKAKGVKLDEHLLGYGAVVIITDRQNPVRDLSVDRVKEILTGKIVNWKEIGGKDQTIKVIVASAKLHPGTFYYVENDILGGAPIAGGAQTMPDFPEVVKKVGETPGAIACVRIRDQFPGSRARTKVLGIRHDEHSEPVVPARDTISEGTYPFRQPYYFYTASTADRQVRSFVEFAVGQGWGQPLLTYVW